MNMPSVILILAMTREWRVSEEHGDIRNAYVEADEVTKLIIYFTTPQNKYKKEKYKINLVHTAQMSSRLNCLVLCKDSSS